MWGSPLISEQYDKVLNFYRTSTNSDERNTALHSLGRAKQPELIKRTLDLILSGEVKDQDIYQPASGLRSHPEGIEALFTWYVHMITFCPVHFLSHHFPTTRSFVLERLRVVVLDIATGDERSYLERPLCCHSVAIPWQTLPSQCSMSSLRFLTHQLSMLIPNRMEGNFDELLKRLPPSLSMFGSMIQIMTSSFSKPEQLAKAEAFFKDKNTNGYDQSLAQSFDSVRSKIAWLARDRGDVAKWLKENGYGA